MNSSSIRRISSAISSSALLAALVALLLIPGLASAHPGHEHGQSFVPPNGRVPGLGDFKRVDGTTYRYRPAQGAYEVREPGSDPGFLHADREPANGEYAFAEGEGSKCEFECVYIGPGVELPPNENAPHCRTAYNRIVVVYTHRASDKSPTPTATIRSIVRRMTWKFASESYGSSGGSRLLQMVVDCNASGEVNVYDVATPNASYTTLGGEVEDALDETVSEDYGNKAVKYLIFEKDSFGETLGIGGPVYTDLSKSRQNANATNTASAIVYSPANWVKHVSIHELLHALGATQSNANPAAPYSIPGNHCYDGQDALCYASEGESYCPASAGFGTPTGVPIDCNKNTYFNAAPPGGSWLANYWNVAGPEDPFLATEQDKAPKATTNSASGVTQSKATLNASITPEGEFTNYYFEYDTDTEYCCSEPSKFNAKFLSGPIHSAVNVSETLEGLKHSTTYHYRVVATNASGAITKGADKTFTTEAISPGISAPPGSAQAEPGGAAVFNAKIYPAGLQTSYQVEYGPTASYGQVVPASPKDIGSDNSWVEVSQEITGLQRLSTYHYRFVATNSKGTTVSPDATFTVPDWQHVKAFQFGSSGSDDGQLSEPAGMALDAEGDIWVVDAGNHRVQQFGPAGEFISKFGSQGSGTGQFDKPVDLALTASGDIWVLDGGATTNRRVQKFSPSGEYLGQFGKQGHKDGEFNSPSGIDIGPNGHIWISDRNSYRVQEFSAEGAFIRSVSFGSGKFVYDVSIDPAGHVWVTVGHRGLLELSSTGEVLSELPLNGTNFDITEGGRPLLASVTSGTDRVREQLTTGAIVGEISSGEDWDWNPEGIVAGPGRSFYVSSAGHDRIEKWIGGSKPIVQTGGASEIITRCAKLSGTVNPTGLATTYHFEYGSTTSYGSSVPVSAKSAGSGIEDVEVGETACGLKLGATYHYRLVATNVDGTTSGNDAAFTTSTTGKPEASTDEASNVSSHKATLNATINPEGLKTSYLFEYGLNEEYGNQTAAQSISAGGDDVARSAIVDGLTYGSDYHYRVIATNAGGVAYGEDRTLSTKPMTTLCKTQQASSLCPEADRYPSETTVEAKLGSGQLIYFNNSLVDVKCSESTLQAKTTTAADNPLALSITSWSLAHCGNTAAMNNCTSSSEASLAGGSILWGVGSEGSMSLGSQTAQRWRIKCTMLGVTKLDCSFDVKPTGTLKGGSAAQLVLAQDPMGMAGGSLCPEKASLAATYEVASPKPLYVARALPSTTLCKTQQASSLCPEADRYPSETTVEAKLGSGQLIYFNNSLVDVKCSESTLQAKTTTAADNPLALSITSWSLAHCGNTAAMNNCTSSSEASLAGGSILWGVGSEGSMSLGSQTAQRWRIKCTMLGVTKLDCSFDVKPTGTLKGGSAAQLVLAQDPMGMAGGSLCPEKASLAATYEVASPKPLYVARALPSTTLCKTQQASSLCPEADRYPSETTVEAKLGSGQLIYFNNSLVDVKCSESTLQAKTTTAADNPLALSITSWSLAHCGNTAAMNNCTSSSEASLAGGSILWGVGSEGSMSLGSQTAQRWRIKCTMLGVTKLDCSFDVKPTGTLKGGSAAQLVLAQDPMGMAGGSLCPEKASLAATYEVASPKPLYVARAG